MSDYYFDIETYSRTPKPDMNNDEIIAITYQKIDSRTGEIKGQLNVLKAWESSEREILLKFLCLLDLDNKWNFVPIGFNLSFDFTSLILRLQKIGTKVNAKQLFAEHPYIDMQHVLLLCNKGAFGGCTLGKFAGKESPGSIILEKYENKDYSAIEKYIKDESEKFINLYQFMVHRLPQVWLEFAEQNGIVI
jgi:hypothetical protein